ncbi:hydroxyethylthiazole kinase [Alkalibacter saccharofermentans]|uniref:Hydroxyethylthiazole kinase n=1 Tax=Alkalibacter saccharofermentans DSM 14828 TaxID=1120975 RepID=A0A1M4ZZY4_9FIRM|nr:hydroxyethylthiazole kinase [Alkalibacter saccharofermentans]SHF23575.1 hydroxyethylthiazole kinase [Alkalibacter saccharofermentans DSM 14828]
MSYNSDYIERIRRANPIVHNITNYVTVNDCANILLAIGASPIMADDEEEVEEIAGISKALVINIGTLNQRTMGSMVKAGKKANNSGIPVILDPVGCGASNMRTKMTLKLLEEVKISVMRGNASEIKSAFSIKGAKTNGVDASFSDSKDLEEICNVARDFALNIKGVVAVTGKEDVVSDGMETYVVKNGVESMAKITGTGCMLSSLTGGFIASNPVNAKTVSAAVATMGLAGELGYSKGMGTGSFRVSLMDMVSLMDDQVLKEGIKIERFKG